MSRRCLVLTTLFLIAGASGPAQAQVTDLDARRAWSVMAGTCVPGVSSLPYMRHVMAGVTFQVGRFLAASGIHLRCQVQRPERAQWDTLRVEYHDPDLAYDQAQVVVTLYRQQSASTPTPLARFDSNWFYWYQASPTVQSVAIANPDFLFDTYTYWLDIVLVRRTATTVAPRVANVWLVHSGR